MKNGLMVSRIILAYCTLNGMVKWVHSSQSVILYCNFEKWFYRIDSNWTSQWVIDALHDIVNGYDVIINTSVLDPRVRVHLP